MIQLRWLLGAVSLLSACGGGGPSGSIGLISNNSVPVVWSGSVYVAAQPLAGAQVSLYAAGSGRDGLPALLAQVRTNAQGQFNVSSVTALPAIGQVVYAVADGSSNAAVRLLGVMGPYCSVGSSATALTPNCSFSEKLTLNELSTVASGYSLAAYLSDTPVVTLAGHALGLQNAAAGSASLVNPATGTPSVGLSNLVCSGASPLSSNCSALQKLNTLANLMAACTRTAVASSSACAQWLNLGRSNGGASATDTLGVVLQIATQPAVRNNGAGVFNAVVSAAIYAPALASAPSDWSLALSLSGGGLNGPAALALDATGHVWVSNSLSLGSLSEFNPDGSAASPDSGFTGNGLSGPQGLALDARGRVWVANWAQGSGSTLSIFNSDGSAAMGSPIAQSLVNGVPSLLGPIDVALGPDGNMWVANYGNSTLSQFSASQQLLKGALSGAGLSFPVSLAVDNNGHVWLVNSSSSTLSEFNAMGAPVQSTAYHNLALNSPVGVALTSTGDLWVANQVGNSLTHIVGGDTPATKCPSPVVFGNTACVAAVLNASGLGLSGPTRVALDGKGTLWVINQLSGSLTAIASDGVLLSGGIGYQTPDMSRPSAIAIDSSGNVWVANYGSNTLIKFIGLAAPVATPKQGQVVGL